MEGWILLNVFLLPDTNLWGVVSIMLCLLVSWTREGTSVCRPVTRLCLPLLKQKQKIITNTYIEQQQYVSCKYKCNCVLCFCLTSTTASWITRTRHQHQSTEALASFSAFVELMEELNAVTNTPKYLTQCVKISQLIWTAFHKEIRQM